jgi:hypothetical protein
VKSVDPENRLRAVEGSVATFHILAINTNHKSASERFDNPKQEQTRVVL